MESEKVKEIKKGLECCSTLMDNNATSEEQDNSCNECPYRLNDRCSWNLDKDALTLINELESENERLKHLREVDYKTMTTLRQASTELNECMDEMQDRITELEKGNEALSFAVKQGFNDCQTKTLKQFAKRLKEKIVSMKWAREDTNEKLIKQGATIKAINKTLNEFLKTKNNN